MKKEYVKPIFDYIAFEVKESLMTNDNTGFGSEEVDDGIEDW